MKRCRIKSLFITILVLGVTNVLWAQSNTFPSSGDVGIGTTTPEEVLHILGNTSSDVTLKIENSSTNGEAQIHLRRFQSDWRIINEHHLFFERENNTYVTFNEDGLVGIGTTTPSELLTVNGIAKAEEVIVEENIGADFVFEEDYSLPELRQVESHIKEYKHLPDIPSAQQMKKEGIKVGNLQIKLLQKIEELTLYAINQSKKVDNQQVIIDRQQEQIQKLSQKLENYLTQQK